MLRHFDDKCEFVSDNILDKRDLSKVPALRRILNLDRLGVKATRAGRDQLQRDVKVVHQKFLTEALQPNVKVGFTVLKASLRWLVFEKLVPYLLAALDSSYVFLVACVSQTFSVLLFLFDPWFLA